MNIKSLTRSIRPRAFEASGRNGRIANNGHLHIGVLGTGIFHRFRHCQRPGFASNFAVTRRVYEIVGQLRGDQIRIVCLLRLKPFLLQCGYSLLGPAGLVGLRPCSTH